MLFRSCDSRKRLVERREIDLLPVVTGWHFSAKCRRNIQVCFPVSTLRVLARPYGALNARSLDKSGWKSIMIVETIILIASLGGEYSSTRKIATLLKQLRENFYIDCRLNLNDRARTLYSQHGIPASQRNGRSELLIVLEYALEDTCPWRGQRHPPTFEHMHRDSSNPTESAGIRSRTRARQGSKRDFTFRETLLTDGRFHVRKEQSRFVSRVAQGKKAPALLTKNHKTQSRYETTLTI
ncbi:hypothetical protein G5I_11612 [Acromyrmex echinatior]|uniref:Uncharacterized protein n=1 Tax=Acromyrmex echinatior TaxID=103372 RepID=F4X030_ACREC|nr:hypothetical protein G5I_11612 [Acromyrmex echinatior]